MAEANKLSQSCEAMLRQLKNPFDAKFVKVRVGATNKDKTKGIALFYIDARGPPQILRFVGLLFSLIFIMKYRTGMQPISFINKKYIGHFLSILYTI